MPAIAVDVSDEWGEKMSRWIDADYLIDTIGAMIGYGTTPTDIWDMVNDAPTIDAVNEWIPCSERLPNWGDSYCLVTYETKHEVGVSIDCWDDDGKNWCDHYRGDRGEVIAWMPLPKPYEEKRP